MPARVEGLPRRKAEVVCYRAGSETVLCDAAAGQIEARRACARRRFCQCGCAGSVPLVRGTWHDTHELFDLPRELLRKLVFGQVKTRQHANLAGPASPRDTLWSDCTSEP
jgi:hypothetical protein